MRMRSGIRGFVRRAGLILLFLGLAVAPTVASAGSSGANYCAQVNAESRLVPPSFEAAALGCKRPDSAETKMAQSLLCCCVGFDGEQCCAQAASCDVSPPGCLCRPK